MIPEIVAGLAGTLVLLVFAPNASAARTYYVDNSRRCARQTGSTRHPFCTIGNAVAAAAAGDDIRIRYGTGTYDESVTATVTGRSGSPITIESDNAGNQAIWRYSVSTQAAALKLDEVNYWTVRNLTFDGTGVVTSSYALWVNGAPWFDGGSADITGIQILNNTFRNWARGTHVGEYYGGVALNVSGGFGPPSASSFSITNTLVQGNVFDGDSGVALQLITNKNTTVKNNEFRNLQCGTQDDGAGRIAVITDGIHDISGTPGWTGNNIISNNSFHDFSNSCGYTATSYIEQDAVHCDAYESNGIADGNLVYNLANTTGAQRGTGFHIEYGCHGWTVKNNVTHDLTGPGAFNDPEDGEGAVNRYYNNTFYGKDNAQGIALGDGYAVVENNILTGGSNAAIWVTGRAVTDGHMAIDHNEYFVTGSAIGIWGAEFNYDTFPRWKADCGCDSNSINSDPLFTNPAGNDFTLKAGSPAIDSGLNLGSPYSLGLDPTSSWPSGVVTKDQNSYGAGWELGAFVFTPKVPNRRARGGEPSPGNTRVTSFRLP
jgi:hypothetical protein